MSTALTEEALSKCVETSLYDSPGSEKDVTLSCTESHDDVKCSVCQVREHFLTFLLFAGQFDKSG